MGSYWIRFTPSNPEAYTLGTVKYVLDTHFVTEKYVLAIEKAASTHFHIALWTTDKYKSNDALKYQLKKYLEGQVYISGKEIQDKIRVIAYCFKDGQYVTKNIDVMTFLQAASISKPKLKYDDLLQTAEKEYSGDDKNFVRNLLDAHIKTNKKIYLQHIKAQLLLTKLKKDQYGTYKEYLVDKIVDLM